MKDHICYNWAVVLRRCRHHNFNHSRFELRGWKAWRVLAWFYICGSYLPTLLTCGSFYWFLLLQSLTRIIFYSFVLHRTALAFLFLIALFVSVWLKRNKRKVVTQRRKEKLYRKVYEIYISEKIILSFNI